MDLISVCLLGIVQGLTEFLPVSSSGHLVLGEYIANFREPGAVFEVFLHAGTLLAILFFFRKEIFRLSKKYLLFLLVATIPAAVFGYLFSPFFEGLFNNPKLVGIALLITGFFNLVTDKNVGKKASLNWQNSIIIGLFQALAIIPGISRSGSTIFAGTRVGIQGKEAAKFSFLLSIPAVVGANFLQFAKYGPSLNGALSKYIAGFAFSFVAGYFAIKVVLKILEQKKFKYFAYYCFLVGILTLILVG
jgi:undecaprenyl-diphosphatase